MKIGLYTDPHWSAYSSILRSRGNKYSTRLENEIQSINWVQKLTKECNCKYVVCLGDFFDRSDITAEELTALKEIKWNDLPQIMLCGNHEMWSSKLEFTSTHLFSLNPNIRIIDSPTYAIEDNTQLIFIPYILEDNRNPIESYYDKVNCKHKIIFSHNDIAGIEMGRFISKAGFTIDNIENNCDLFLNGHLHNGSKISDKIINLGNLTGQNFSEDALRYNHNAYILDTDTLKIDVYENPYALNFYKLDVTEYPLNEYCLKSNCVISLKCYQKDSDYYKELFNKLKKEGKLLDSRLTIQPDQDLSDIVVDGEEMLSVDHLKQFRDYIIENLGTDNIAIEELQEILK